MRTPLAPRSSHSALPPSAALSFRSRRTPGAPRRSPASLRLLVSLPPGAPPRCAALPLFSRRLKRFVVACGLGLILSLSWTAAEIPRPGAALPRAARTGADSPAEGQPADGGADAASILRLADEVLQQVSRLRGLPVRVPVGRELHSEASLRAYISRRLQKEYPGDRLQREQRLLEILGVLPAGIDLSRAVNDLYAAQTAGYYDPERRTLCVSDRLPAVLQRPTLAHELTHALQDQHFQIGRFLLSGPSGGDEDARLAMMGLVEGEATAVMLAALGSPESPGAWVERLAPFESGLLETLAAAGVDAIPPFLVHVLNFPYRYGTAFVASLYRAGGWEAVSAAYGRPPRSSEQVLHPARYSSSADEPSPVARETFPDKVAGLRLHYDLVLGEFVTRLVLESLVERERASRAAEGWDGDRAALYTGERGELLVWLSEWDSPAEAAEFAQAVRAAPGNGRVIEMRGARVIHLRGRGGLETGELLELATGFWPLWR